MIKRGTRRTSGDMITVVTVEPAIGPGGLREDVRETEERRWRLQRP